MKWNQNSTKVFPKWKMSPARKMFSTFSKDLQYCLMPGSLLLCGQAWANQPCEIRLRDFTKWTWLVCKQSLTTFAQKSPSQIGFHLARDGIWSTSCTGVETNLLVGSSPLTPGDMAAHLWFCCPAAAQVHVPAASSETSDTSHTLRRGHGKMSSYFQFGSLAVLVSLGTGNCPHKLSHCVRIHN